MIRSEIRSLYDYAKQYWPQIYEQLCAIDIEIAEHQAELSDILRYREAILKNLYDGKVTETMSDSSSDILGYGDPPRIRDRGLRI